MSLNIYDAANSQLNKISISSGDGSDITVESLSVNENGTYTAPIGTAYSPVTVNIETAKGFELYGAGFGGNTQTFIGMFDNNYLTCFFHDNMTNSYVLNGVTENFSAVSEGYSPSTTTTTSYICGTAKAVSNNTPSKMNAWIESLGSVMTTTHLDSGSYASIVGGWVGYPANGTIYENALSNAVQNSIIMNSAHKKLLIFVGGSGTALSGATIDINGVTYNITNIGYKYDHVYSVYAAIEIDNNTDTIITVTFPASCYNYVSIIGLDG